MKRLVLALLALLCGASSLLVWLRQLGLKSGPGIRRGGLGSHEKFVPGPVFSVPKRQLALFLRHLWATDGCVWWDEKVGQARIYYASTSRRLVDDVARLLLRFNVMTRVKETRKGDYRPCYHLLVYGAENQLRFLDDQTVVVNAPSNGRFFTAQDVISAYGDIVEHWKSLVRHVLNLGDYFSYYGQSHFIDVNAPIALGFDNGNLALECDIDGMYDCD
jgi:hypothetical protein